VPALFPFYALEVHKEGGLLPLAGISTSTTVLCNELGPYSIYFSDEHGFNNPKGWPETADAVLIGDSFVHGQCVPPGADIAARLRARGWRVLNLGASGSGPLFELAVLSEYGLARKPKAVIWVYIGNDEGELLTEMLNPTLRRYLSGGFSQKLLERQQEIDTFWKGYLEEYVERSEAEKRRTDARPTVKTVNWREIFTMYPLRKALGLRRIQQGDRLQGVRTVLTRARDVSRGAGAELVLAIMPYWQIVKDHPGKGFEDVQAIGEELGIPVINFSPIFAEDPDPLRYFPYRLPGHFNEEGYEFVAKHLSERVMEKLAR
jgi:hypothetical protein